MQSKPFPHWDNPPVKEVPCYTFVVLSFSAKVSLIEDQISILLVTVSVIGFHDLPLAMNEDTITSVAE